MRYALALILMLLACQSASAQSGNDSYAKFLDVQVFCRTMAKANSLVMHDSGKQIEAIKREMARTDGEDFLTRVRSYLQETGPELDALSVAITELDARLGKGLDDATQLAEIDAEIATARARAAVLMRSLTALRALAVSLAVARATVSASEAELYRCMAHRRAELERQWQSRIRH